MTGRKIMVAMSGGVDSSVAAFLLKQEGHDVAGVTMRLGTGDPAKKCRSPEVDSDAQRVCRHIGIPHYVQDFSAEFERVVIGDFIDEYRAGRTPNPCVRCNRHLKFGILLEKALSLGFDSIATGHYARIIDSGNGKSLHRALDRTKDQSYFLYSIQADTFARVMFPLGTITKKEVREIARREALPAAEKAESQDICFASIGGHGDFFRSRGIPPDPGDIVDASGARIGGHSGYMRYTIGQRRGLGIAHREPLYVIHIDPGKNLIYAGVRDELKARGLTAGDVNFFVHDIPAEASVKIRHAGADIPCAISLKDGVLEIYFDTPREAVTPGQSAVLYAGEAVIGGGIIREVIR